MTTAREIMTPDATVAPGGRLGQAPQGGDHVGRRAETSRSGLDRRLTGKPTPPGTGKAASSPVAPGPGRVSLQDSKGPLRVVIIAPPWVPVPPPAYGGTEAVLDSLARGLGAAGHDVLLFATGDSACPVPTRWARPTAAGTVAIGPAAELHHVIHAYHAALEFGADVVHDHTLVGPVYAQRFDIPGPFAIPWPSSRFRVTKHRRRVTPRSRQ
jgi:hypothetical protein